MDIEFKRGRKADDDRIILINTDGAEAITIPDVGLLVNQLALNETRINDHLDWDKYDFYFGNFINDAIEHGHNDVDWSNPQHVPALKAALAEVELALDDVDARLLDEAQTQLQAWQAADPNPNPYQGDVDE